MPNINLFLLGFHPFIQVILTFNFRFFIVLNVFLDMRKLIFLLSLCSIGTIQNSFAQAPVLQWQKCLGGTNEDVPFSIRQTKNGGYIIAGSSKSNDGDVTGNHSASTPYEDFWVVKTDSVGNLQWQKSLGGTNKDVANSIIQCSDGGYAVAGYTESTDGDVTNYRGGVSDHWVVRLDTAGNIKWQKTLGGSGEDGVEEIQQTTDGGFVVIGWSTSNTDTLLNHDFDYHIIKLDTSGIVQWQKFYGGTGDDTPYFIEQTADGGYVACGYSESNDLDVTGHHGALNYRDCWVIKLDSLGNLKHEKSFGGTGIEEGTTVQQTNEGGYIFAGWSTVNDGDVSGGHGSYDCWVVKFDTSFAITWQNCYGGTSVDQAFAIEQTTDRGYIVGGVTFTNNNGQVSGNHGAPDFWAVKTDSTGNFLWQKCLGGSNWEASSCTQQTSDGGFIMTGSTASVDGDVTGFHGGNYDFWVVKLFNFTTDVSNENENNFTIYPNPVSENVNIQLNSENTKISIYNSMGQKILNQITDQKNRIISLQNLPEGVYTVEVINGSKSAVKKMIKINH
jgi:hypothetical protein